MSTENLDLVTRALRATQTRPKPDFATINALFHPDHVLVPQQSQIESEEFRGARGFQAFMREQGQPGLSDGAGEAPVSWESDLEGAVDVGSDKVLAVATTRYRGAASGAELEQRTWYVVTVRDGRVFRTEVYSDPAKALEAASLPGHRSTTASTNVEVVRSIYADWERGDFSAAEWAQPEIEFVMADGPSPGSWRGLAGMAAAWRDFLSAWEEFRSEAEEYRELDDQRVLVLAHFSARGKTSGLEAAQLHVKAASLFHVRDGKVTRYVNYYDRERALADLGLASETDSLR
jgi:ketosteroid isomerase-like protein